MPIGCLHIRLDIPGCRSLKEKRSRLKPFLVRIRKEFNLAAAETGLLDTWQTADISLVTVGNEAAHVMRSLQKTVEWVETHWPDLHIQDDRIEIF